MKGFFDLNRIRILGDTISFKTVVFRLTKTMKKSLTDSMSSSFTAVVKQRHVGQTVAVVHVTTSFQDLRDKQISVWKSTSLSIVPPVLNTSINAVKG